MSTAAFILTVRKGDGNQPHTLQSERVSERERENKDPFDKKSIFFLSLFSSSFPRCEAMSLSPSDESLCEVLYDYMHCHHSLLPADVILVFCSNDPRVARYSADLFLRSLAPIILFSGGVGRGTRGKYAKAEAEVFGDIAAASGVPRECIMIESLSTNTGENIIFSSRVLASAGVLPQRLIVVQKPYMEKRAFATLMKQWPSPLLSLAVTSPPLSWSELVSSPPHMTIDAKEEGEGGGEEGEGEKERRRVMWGREVTCMMVGDVQRMRVYGEKGFQVPMPIPEGVWDAYLLLRSRGYDDDVLKE
jgi:uncharacterized SAM-binding protein YcdF (DUF218 family)